MCVYTWVKIQWPMSSRLFSLWFRMIFYCIKRSRVLSPSAATYTDSFVSAFNCNGILLWNSITIGRKADNLKTTCTLWQVEYSIRFQLQVRTFSATAWNGQPLYHFSLFRNYCGVCLFRSLFFFIILVLCPSYHHIFFFQSICGCCRIFFIHFLFAENRGGESSGELESFLALDANSVRPCVSDSSL